MEIKTRSILKDILLPYQQGWVADASRFKVGMWSRQTGKSFSTACEAVVDCSVQPADSSTHWVIMSAGERQALEWMDKAKKWAEAVRFTIDSYDERLNLANPTLSKAEIRFGNGARITAIPANPDTARGYSANIILDEFAIHEKPFDIWGAVFPSITNPLSGEKKLRVVSTPKGRGNKFADIWEHSEAYSKHLVTIEDAVALGLFGADRKVAAKRLAELRAGVDDDDIWAQEYMCEFIDNSSVLLTYELIGKCESDQIRDDGSSPLYIGMDIGRRKDLSVIITAARQGDVLTIIGVDTLSKMPFADQLKILVDKARASRVQGVCIDSTGIGAMLAEEAEKALGGKCRGVPFTSASKGEMYGLMRRRFEERSVRVPIERTLREDLHAVQRLVSSTGSVTYSAPRSDDGHSDRAAALALCCLAAKGGVEISPRAVSGGQANQESRSI